MVVDDSVVIRGLIGRWIDEERSLAVVASHRNGRLAVDDVKRANPDVVVLDIEMPDMDGLTALPLLLKQKPNLVVIIASTLSRRNAEISLKALSLGAADYVPKPEGNSQVTTSAEFRRELIEKVTNLGERAKRRPARAMSATVAMQTRTAQQASAQPAAPAGATPIRMRQPVEAPAVRNKSAFTLKSYSASRPRVLCVGSSTGGPQALNAFFGHVGSSMGNIPVLLTQHMPPTFTAILAEHLTKAAGRPAAEGQDGEVVRPGRIYVAPGGKHMTVAKTGTEMVIRLNDGPPVNFCKPAVDPLFQSAVEAYGSAVLGVILTGMGADGAKGVTQIAQAGGNCLAQDEETSVVWGMPGAAAHTGMCADVLPLDELGRKVARILMGGRL
ncbi:protein-glutamate methylesterase/protein-glutamine glutaminase [Hartmannibacter diazotrophicus]|nr:chemotaxis response regulator protein-glutamate methylesterase [Hartmannibacter diazotrophicus]